MLLPYTAEEEPEVRWLKDGKHLKQTKANKRLRIDWNISDDSYFLEIHNATLEDVGKYTVVVSNDAGRAEVITEVKVTEVKEMKLPAFTKKPDSVSVIEGEKVRLQFQLEEGNLEQHGAL